MESEGIGIVSVIENEKSRSIEVLYDNGETYGVYPVKQPKKPAILDYLVLLLKELIHGPQEQPEELHLLNNINP